MVGVAQRFAAVVVGQWRRSLCLWRVFLGLLWAAWRIRGRQGGLSGGCGGYLVFVEL
jgi:hypothetical protein